MSGAGSAAASEPLARQHLIDPEICIRCNTCEATCPNGAITHDDRNYVVKFDVCGSCNACIPPCPTGAIDNWRMVDRRKVYSIEEQFGWDSLPEQQTLEQPLSSGLPEEVERQTAEARKGQDGHFKAPHSAPTPVVNLYTRAKPIEARVTGNFRLTEPGASADVRHIVLDFGAQKFPVLEGQTIGIVPPGQDVQGRAHFLRLYSVASPREGERPGFNNVAITVKRVTEDHEGIPVQGVASNFLCDLNIGATVQVTGPYGSTFLMPDHAGSSLLMICTGTGSAPMRAMTERRRRRIALNEGGRLMLFFGARAPGELPYFGPLKKLPASFIDINLAFSRDLQMPRRYVQDLIRERWQDVAALLMDAECYVYVCGLKSMEAGVLDAFQYACENAGMDWPAMKRSLLESGRLHIETY